MQKSTEIANELKEISPALAGISPVNVYRIPEGYFDQLPAAIFRLIQKSQSVGFGKTDQFSQDVPAGYFDGLADTILNKVKLMEADEHTEAELSPLMQSLRQKNVYQVPAGYFDGLADAIGNKTMNESADEELKTLSPLLYSLQNNSPYKTPEGYFENLSASLLEKVQPQPARVVKMGNRSKFMKYAAAAVVTGVLTFTGYQFINKGQGTSVEPQQMAQLTQTQLDGLKIQANGTFESEMDKLSDESIVKYLEASGEDVDAASVAGMVDEKDLPNQEDYLFDDKTLDNFLNNVSDKTLKN